MEELDGRGDFDDEDGGRQAVIEEAVNEVGAGDAGVRLTTAWIGQLHEKP